MKDIIDKLGEIMIGAAERDGNHKLAEELKKYIKGGEEVEVKKETYPKIEKIFIDFDVYIHRMISDKETLEINSLAANYQAGYRQCYIDIRNRIRKLIDKEVKENVKTNRSSVSTSKKV